MPGEYHVRSDDCVLPCATDILPSSLGIIHDALAADFDGDSKLDLFVLYKIKADQNGFNGGILWGDREKLSECRFGRSHTGIANETMILGEMRWSLLMETEACVSPCLRSSRVKLRRAMPICI